MRSDEKIRQSGGKLDGSYEDKKMRNLKWRQTAVHLLFMPIPTKILKNLGAIGKTASQATRHFNVKSYLIVLEQSCKKSSRGLIGLYGIRHKISGFKHSVIERHFTHQLRVRGARVCPTAPPPLHHVRPRSVERNVPANIHGASG